MFTQTPACGSLSTASAAVYYNVPFVTVKAAVVQVDLPKPLGLRFARGADSGAYIIENNPKLGNTDPRIQVCPVNYCSFTAWMTGVST